LCAAIAWLGEVFACDRFPCSNTYCNVCQQFDEQDLNRQLTAFCRTCALATDAATSNTAATAAKTGLRQMARDGKEPRGTYRHLHHGSAMLGVNDVALACTEAMRTIAGKGHEPAALQAWLKHANLHTCLITADALHTQTELCRLARQQHGHDLLIVKQNQPQLRAASEQLFTMPADRRFPHGHSQSTDNGHGRFEVRELRCSSERNNLLATR
jgi:predicted transposase YbfD/YdcC